MRPFLSRRDALDVRSRNHCRHLLIADDLSEERCSKTSNEPRQLDSERNEPEGRLLRVSLEVREERLVCEATR